MAAHSPIVLTLPLRSWVWSTRKSSLTSTSPVNHGKFHLSFQVQNLKSKRKKKEKTKKKKRRMMFHPRPYSTSSFPQSNTHPSSQVPRNQPPRPRPLDKVLGPGPLRRRNHNRVGHRLAIPRRRPPLAPPPGLPTRPLRPAVPRPCRLLHRHLEHQGPDVSVPYDAGFFGRGEGNQGQGNAGGY